MSFVSFRVSRSFAKSAVIFTVAWTGLAGCGVTLKSGSDAARSSSTSGVKDGDYALALCLSDSNSDLGGHSLLSLKAIVKDNRVVSMKAPLLEFALAVDVEVRGASSRVDSSGEDVIDLDVGPGTLSTHDARFPIEGMIFNLTSNTINIIFQVQGSDDVHSDSIQVPGCKFSNLSLLKL